ncbi:hypothetical protein Tco_0795921 [Tanacetum coccineum]
MLHQPFAKLFIEKVMIDARHGPIGFIPCVVFAWTMVMNSSSIPIEYRMTLNSLDLHTSSGLLTPYSIETGNFMPPKPDLSFSGLEEFTSEPIVIKPIVEKSEAKASEAKPKVVRKSSWCSIY